MSARKLYAVVSGLCLAAGGAQAIASESAEEDLPSLSIEELLDIEVTIVSKTEERLVDAAGAVSVITREDARRVAARSIPEALRLAPGLHISRVTSSTWGVSSRGFSSANSAKLLVLIDGRSIYTPLFSGVFWDVQDVLFEDIDRIEVVRGPGASLWGANAVNGVINIISKSARETQGSYVEAGGGNEHHGFAAARHGGAVGEDFHYRVYTQAFTDDGGHNGTGPQDDDWRMARLGFRADARLGADSEVTVQSEGYLGKIGQVDPSLTLNNVPPPESPLEVDVAGGFVNASWMRRLGERADLVVRATYDRTHRDDPTYRDTLDVIDLGGKSQIQLPGDNELVVGGNYRLMNDEFRGKGVAELRPASSMDHLVSGFAQDTLSLFDRALRITAGAKLERNDFSGVEFQPAVRVAVTPAAAHTSWAALSRAVRVPTRIERDIFAEAATPGQPTIQLIGNVELASEELVAAELGHRWRALPNLLVDLAGYHFRYDSLIGYEIGTVMQDGEEVIVPVLNRNAMHGHSSGGELAVLWSPLSAWQLTATYSHCRIELEPDSDAMDPTNAQNIERMTPRHQGSLRSSLDLPGGFQLDGFGRLVGRTNRADPFPAVPRYIGLDARLAWRATSQIEVSVVGQNLLDNHKLEFPGGTEVERSFFGKVVGRF